MGGFSGWGWEGDAKKVGVWPLRKEVRVRVWGAGRTPCAGPPPGPCGWGPGLREKREPPPVSPSVVGVGPGPGRCGHLFPS